jgi:hypothetical protein
MITPARMNSLFCRIEGVACTHAYAPIGMFIRNLEASWRAATIGHSASPFVSRARRLPSKSEEQLRWWRSTSCAGCPDMLSSNTILMGAIGLRGLDQCQYLLSETWDCEPSSVFPCTCLAEQHRPHWRPLQWARQGLLSLLTSNWSSSDVIASASSVSSVALVSRWLNDSEPSVRR